MAPEPAYQASAGGALDVDRAFYTRIAERTATEVVEQFEIPIRSGRAWVVPQGRVCRIVTVEGPQVADLNVWNAENPRERFWASRTRQLQATHVTTFDRLKPVGLPEIAAARRGRAGCRPRGRKHERRLPRRKRRCPSQAALATSPGRGRHEGRARAGPGKVANAARRGRRSARRSC